MNIYARKGDKVICNTLSGGYDHHEKIANSYLKLNEEYTINYTEVDSWSTDVYLQEFPGVKFNSVFFEDVIVKDEKLNQLHPDYDRFNS